MRVIYICFVAGCISGTYAQWTRSSQSLGLVWDLEESPNGVVYAGSNHGVFRSSDGNNWELADSGLHFGEGSVYTLLTIDNELYCGTELGLYRLNNDEVWEKTTNDIDDILVRDILSLLVKDSILFSGTLEKGVFRSVDKGLTWTESNNGVPSSTVQGFTSFPSVRSLTCIGESIFGSFSGALYRSDDNGNNWYRMEQDSIGSIFSIAVLDSQLYISAGVGVNGGIFRSTNLGQTWQRIYTTEINSLITRGGDIFAGGWNELAFSSDGGDSWKSFGEGLSDEQVSERYVYSMLVYDNNFYVGTRFGSCSYSSCSSSGDIFKRSLTDFYGTTNVGVTSKNQLLSVGNNQVNISLHKDSYIDLKLFTIQGKIVLPVTERYLQAGNYKFKLDSKKINSGQYLLGFRSEGHSFYKKINTHNW